MLAYLALLSTVIGCAVPIPTPATVKAANIPFYEVETLGPGETIAVVSADGPEHDNDKLPTCIYKGLVKADPNLRVMDGAAFREALSPWLGEADFRFPKTGNSFPDILKQPEVATAISNLNIRYLLVVTGSTYEHYTGHALPPPYPAAMGSGVEGTRLMVDLWDLRLSKFLGPMEVDASGEGTVAVMGFGYYTLPAHEATACKAMVGLLEALFTDGEFPSDVKPFVEERRKTAEELRLNAMKGDIDAATILAKDFHNPTALETLAEQGDIAAAGALLRVTDDSEPLERLAAKGDSNAAYALYNILVLRSLTDKQVAADAWTWLCRAASLNDSDAQFEIARWYRSDDFSMPPQRWAFREFGVRTDNKVAYMWYTLADDNGHHQALVLRDRVAKYLTPKEIAEAEQMVRDWRPSDCSIDKSLPSTD